MDKLPTADRIKYLEDYIDNLKRQLDRALEYVDDLDEIPCPPIGSDECMSEERYVHRCRECIKHYIEVDPQ